MSKVTWTYKWDNPEAVLEKLNIARSLQDFIDKHKGDMDFMLKEHFDGGVIKVSGYTFTIEADSRFDECDCEIENLAWSGSKFNVDGVIVVLTPLFI